MARGLDELHLERNRRLAPALRVLLALDIPRQTKSVVFAVPRTAEGRTLFNLVRHVLELHDLAVAATIDLQRLQMASQLIVQLESWPPYLRQLERHGVALLLFPPLLNVLFDQTNAAHGRASAAAIRNCAARVHFMAQALCRWLQCASSAPPRLCSPSA